MVKKMEKIEKSIKINQKVGLAGGIFLSVCCLVLIFVNQMMLDNLGTTISGLIVLAFLVLTIIFSLYVNRRNAFLLAKRENLSISLIKENIKNAFFLSVTEEVENGLTSAFFKSQFPNFKLNKVFSTYYEKAGVITVEGKLNRNILLIFISPTQTELVMGEMSDSLSHFGLTKPAELYQKIVDHFTK